VPYGFANGLSRLLRQFVNSTTGRPASSTGGNFQTQHQNDQSISVLPIVNARSASSTGAQNGLHKTQAGPSQFTSANVSAHQPTLRRVLLVVKVGTDYGLAQIPIHGITSLEFFKKLRSEYFRLRGYWRRYLSVWRYSHCDFYKVPFTYRSDFGIESLAHERSVRKVR
jgi:hypothetical protein